MEEILEKRRITCVFCKQLKPASGRRTIKRLKQHGSPLFCCAEPTCQKQYKELLGPYRVLKRVSCIG